jgi:tripartite-type tricarboxylate transporter receptor subunit TctC
MIVPFTAGGGTDLIARLIAQKLSEKWNQPFVVENRTGANGNIGAQAVAQAKPDGYTILVSSSAVTINPSLNENVGYQQKDLIPVIRLASSPFLLVANPKLVGAQNLDDFIMWTKAQPASAAWASTSEGNAEHLAGSLLQRMANFTMRHIPYKGGADAVKDVLGGHVAVGVVSLPTSMPYLQGGQLKVLGSTDTRRAPQIPDVPTIGETIPGF